MNSPRSFQLRLFGSPSLTGPEGGTLAGRAVQRHRVALLALLVLSPGRCATRDKLMGYLWPENDHERARQLLNQAVYHLRKALGEDAILSVGDELRLSTEIVETDVLLFEAALARGDFAGAVSLYGGPLLDGVFLGDALEYERWVERERDRLARAQAGALEALAEAAEQAGDLPRAVEWWKARAALDPYDSRVAIRLVGALEAAGNRAGALQQAGVHARLLEAEFGIAPPAELAELTERLRAEPAPAAHVGGAAVTKAAVTRAATGDDVASARPALVPPATSSEPSPAAVAVADGTPAVSGAEPGARPAFRRLRPRAALAGYASLATVATLLVAAALWFWGPGAGDRWLRDSAMPKIEKALAVADWESAFALAREAERRTPGSRDVAELWPRLSWHVKLESEPAGATVYRQAYDAPGDAWEELGRTPLPDVRIPYGLSRLRFELPGYRPLVRALGGAHINWRELEPIDDRLLVGPDLYHLDTAETLPADMVRVPGFTLWLPAGKLELRDFFLGRYEVTNEAYRAFVDAGGYRRRELWDPVVVNGDTLPFEAAMARFVDRTGRPGPSTWQAGDYPAGEADYPVSGVSWYEAAAYARFVGRELPTAAHWQEALANSMFPWLLPASNFSGRGPRRTAESRAMSHVGAFDLAGNVREWTSSAIGSERVILGGSFNDPYYIAGTTDTSAPPEDRSEGNGIRLAITMDPPDVAARVRAPIHKRTTAAPVVTAKPVSDETYAAFGRFFDYDRGPLRAVIEAVDTTRLWIHQRVRLDAGYRGERMLLNLYLPATGSRPLQAVVYWPGWDTFWLDDENEYFTKQVDFIVKSGRAVAFPVFRGTFERKVGGATRRAEFGTAEYRDNTIETVKELRRTVDYLAARSDIDSSRVALFAYSWGGVNGPTALAQEPRLRAAVIYIGLLPPMAATPEVDPVNALPRVHVPVLLFSGEFDPMVPRANANRYFELIGVPAERKKHVIAIGGHFIPRDLLIRETLEWLDGHLGPTGR